MGQRCYSSSVSVPSCAGGARPPVLRRDHQSSETPTRGLSSEALEKGGGKESQVNAKTPVRRVGEPSCGWPKRPVHFLETDLCATEAVDGLRHCPQFDCLAASVAKPRIVGVTSGGELRASVSFPGVFFSLN